MTERTGQLKPEALVPVVAIPIFLAIANQTMISVALPDIGVELGELEHLPWLVIGYMLALTIAGPVYGVLGDSYGRSRMLVTALWVYIAGAVICTIAPSIEVLAIGRLFQGLGGGGLMSLSQALIGQLVAPRDRGRAQGYVASIGVTASTLGPVVGGLLVAGLGWRSLFAVTIPLALIAMVIILRLDMRHEEVRHRPFDLKGFMLLNVLVISATVALELLKVQGQAIWAFCCAVLGVISLVLLVRSQRSSKNPFFPPALFNLPAVSRAFVLVVCHGAALVSLVTIIPLFQSILRGDSTVEVALMLLAVTVAFGISGIITGNLITWTGRTTLFPTISLPLAAAGIIALGFFGAGMDRPLLIAVYVAIGLSIGSVMATVHTTVQHETPDALRGRAAGSVTFFRSVGAVIGTALASLVLFSLAPISGAGGGNSVFASGGGQIDPADLAGWIDAFRWTFLTIAGFVLLGWSMAATTRARRIT